MHNIRKFLAFAIFGTLTTTGAFGQSPTGGTTFLDIISPQQELGITLSQNYEHQFSSDLKGGFNGDLAADVYTTGLDYANFWKQGFVRAGFGYEYSDWDWSGPTYLSDTQKLSLQTIGGYRFDQSDWGVFGLVGSSLGAETSGADLGDGYSYRFGFGGTYHWGQRSSFSLGIMLIGQTEYDLKVLPLPILNWQITDQLNLRTFNGFTLTYDVFGNNQTNVDFTTQYESDTFRLKNQTIRPGLTGDPIVNKDSVIIAAGVTQRFLKSLYVRAYVEGIVYREFEFRYSRNNYRTIKTDPGIAIGLQGGWNF
ncbi:hypothetical protein [Cerasicoccus maritimus]|uniref:hypothetical protein n=1 Tax=Cerasicoccus maritimus TaxID=490089 RepID=UPI0028525475|nr:hypothetical protein [Cerasicoccus maritimus]